MANKYIKIVIGSIAMFNLFINYIIGLAPYTFNIKQKTMKVSKFGITYSIILSLVLIIVYPRNVFILYKHFNTIVKTDVPAIAIGTIKFLEYLSLIFVYYVQCRNRHKFVKYINKIINFNKTYEFNEENPNNYSIIQRDAQFIPYIIAILVKILLDFLIIITKIMCYNYLITISADNYYLLIIIDLMPMLTLLFALNGFIFGLLQSHFTFKQINKHTKILSNDIYNIKIQYKNNQIKYYEYQKKMCELSDRLDVLAICHSESCHLVRTMNKFYSIPLLFVILLGFMDIIQQVKKTFVRIQLL